MKFNGSAFHGFTYDGNDEGLNSHGTFCAGIVADVAREARIISVKVCAFDELNIEG